VCRTRDISEATFDRWKQLDGGLMPSEVKKGGVASRHHGRTFGDALVGQPQAVLPRQPVQSPDGRMQKLGVGRKGDGLRLHRGVDRIRARVWLAMVEASKGSRSSGGLVQCGGHVLTISCVAEMLCKDEDWLSELSIDMSPVRFFGLATDFTDYGVACDRS
jgi:hypothetical protein